MRLPQRLNAIIDVDAAAEVGWAPLDLADACLRGGARFLQLRAKTLASGPLLDIAVAMAAKARDAGATLIVNDRGDIARLAGAAGVHVGQADLAPQRVRAIVGDAAIVGLSTHSTEQVERALAQPVNYVAIGPVFATRTKMTGYDAIGIEGVRQAAARTTAAGVPLVAIGGITIDRAAAVLDAGAAAVAVVGALLMGGDPEARVREFLKKLGN